MVNRCGCYCDECNSFQKECKGCHEICGKVYWAEYIGEDTCPIFKCCDEKKIDKCGRCSEIPCKKWYELKDPSLSDEEHLSSIDKRVKLLMEEGRRE